MELTTGTLIQCNNTIIIVTGMCDQWLNYRLVSTDLDDWDAHTTSAPMETMKDLIDQGVWRIVG